MSVATPPKLAKLVLPKVDTKLSLGIAVAIGLKREIGQEGMMPWYLPEDLKHFKQLTLNSCVIMGRKTFDSIGRPLPSRRNIVVTQDKSFADKFRVEVASSLDEALVIAASAQGALDCAQKHGINLQEAERIEYEQCFVIGGARLFSEALLKSDKVVITYIRSEFNDADVFFPNLPAERNFRLVETRPAQNEKFQKEGESVFTRFYHSDAEQPVQFKQTVPVDNSIELVDEQGCLLEAKPKAGLDFCYATYVANSY